MSSLKKNLIYQSIYQVFIVILPLITAPYVARVLGSENSGIYSFSHTAANYFFVFGMLGLEQYGNRSIAQVRDNKEETNRVFSELLLLHAIVSLCAIVSYTAYCFLFVSSYRFYFLLQEFYIVSVLFDINWFFFGIEKFKITVTRNTVIKVVSVISIFLFVRDKNDLWIYTFILSISSLLTQIAVWPFLFKYVKVVRVPLSSITKHCKPLLLLFVAVISAHLNRMIDKMMLGWFKKMSELGCYDYADRIIRIPLSFIAAVGTVMLSKMSNLFAKDNPEKTVRILNMSACLVLFLSFGMGFGILAIAPEFVIWFLGIEYKETIVLLSILSVSIPIVGWNNYVRTQLLIPKEMDTVYTRAVVAGAAFNIAINCFLIRFLGAKGAAIATVVSYLLIMVVQIIPIYSQVKSSLKYVMAPMIIGFIMYGTIRSCSLIIDNNVLSLAIGIIVGIIVYGGISFVYLKNTQPLIIKALLNRKSLHD